MSLIDRVEIREFSFDTPDIGLEQAAAGIGNMAFVKGSTFTSRRFAVRISCDDGAAGEYVTHWVGTPASLAQAAMLAPLLPGRDPDSRELIYDDLKREVRAYDHMGHGVLDIALWDLAGKRLGTSVSRLLGGFKTRLPAYASTYHGQEAPGGLDTPQTYADFAAECQAAGFHGFKIHGWNDGNVAREIANLRGVRARAWETTGASCWIPPASCAPGTMPWRWGRVCDEIGCFWYEDPYRDASIALEGHRRLRERLDTPLLITEHVRTLEQKAAFLVGGGCDMIHADPEYDLGITGVMKIAHLSEAFGLDLQVHACGPAHRAVGSALRNTHLYELALMAPGMANMVPPVYTCGYSDQPEAVVDGFVPVPDGAGLGVTYDWEFIAANTTATYDFR